VIRPAAAVALAEPQGRNDRVEHLVNVVHVARRIADGDAERAWLEAGVADQGGKRQPERVDPLRFLNRGPRRCAVAFVGTFDVVDERPVRRRERVDGWRQHGVPEVLRAGGRVVCERVAAAGVDAEDQLAVRRAALEVTGGGEHRRVRVQDLQHARVRGDDLLRPARILHDQVRAEAAVARGRRLRLRRWSEQARRDEAGYEHPRESASRRERRCEIRRSPAFLFHSAPLIAVPASSQDSIKCGRPEQPRRRFAVSRGRRAADGGFRRGDLGTGRRTVPGHGEGASYRRLSEAGIPKDEDGLRKGPPSETLPTWR